MDTLNEVNTLISQINKEINRGVCIEISDSKHKKYVEYMNHIDNKRTQLKREKYKWVFIGDKGIGKTTTILELFGLIKDGDDLLTTAAGGTTTCEVELLKSEKSYPYFEIIPVDDNKMIQYIEDFSLSYKPADNQVPSNEKQYVPTEIARSIRNMLGMTKEELKQCYKTLNSFDEFTKFIYKKLDLDNRKDTVINCKCNNSSSFFKEVQAQFNSINLCKISSIKLPEKIKIYLTADIFDFEKYPNILSIVDTRGIDSIISSSNNNKNMNREDIIHYVDDEQEKCLYFFMDGIKPVPSPSLINILKSRITTDNIHKFYLLVNIYNNEAEEIMTDDGKANDAQTGIHYRTDDVLDKFRQNSMRFNTNNLIFYNARKNYPKNSAVLAQIVSTIEEKRKQLFSDCNNLKIAFEKLKYDFENKEYAFKNFDDLYSIVIKSNTPKDILERVILTFIDEELSYVHHARINAINKNKGNYYAYNYYFHYSMSIEQIFDEIFLDSKNKVITKVNEFFGYKNIDDIDKIDYKIYIENLERDYIQYRSILKDELKDILQKAYRSQSWQNAIDQYGQRHKKVYGEPPYKVRVLEIYKNELLYLTTFCDMQKEYEAKWQRILKENYLAK